MLLQGAESRSPVIPVSGGQYSSVNVKIFDSFSVPVFAHFSPGKPVPANSHFWDKTWPRIKMHCPEWDAFSTRTALPVHSTLSQIAAGPEGNILKAEAIGNRESVNASAPKNPSVPAETKFQL